MEPVANAWVRPKIPTRAQPTKDPQQKLSSVVVSVNGHRRIVGRGEELAVVRGDTVEIVSANLPNRDEADIGRVNLLGYGNRGGKIGEDRGYKVRTDRDLLEGWSEHRQGNVYAVSVETGSVLHGAIYLKMIEPQLRYAVLDINGKERVLRAGAELTVKAEDEVEVDDVVTNLHDADHVTFQIVALQPANVLELPKPQPGDKRQFEIRFLRYGKVFAKIPMQVVH